MVKGDGGIYRRAWDLAGPYRTARIHGQTNICSANENTTKRWKLSFRAFDSQRQMTNGEAGWFLGKMTLAHAVS